MPRSPSAQQADIPVQPYLIDLISKAIDADDIDSLKHLGLGDIISKKIDEHGNTMLHWAAGSGSLKVAEYLVGQDADVNATANRGWSPVTEAAYWSQKYALQHASDKATKCLQVKMFLQDNGGKELGDPDTKTFQSQRGVATNVGKPPTDQHELRRQLMGAAIHDNVKTLQRVLNTMVGAIRETDGSGNTALHRAAEYGSERSVRMLIKHGAHVNALNHRGWSPLTCAQYWAQESARRDGQKEFATKCLNVVMLLKDKGGKLMGTPDTVSSKCRRAADTGSCPDSSDECFYFSAEGENTPPAAPAQYVVPAAAPAKGKGKGKGKSKKRTPPTMPPPPPPLGQLLIPAGSDPSCGSSVYSMPNSSYSIISDSTMVSAEDTMKCFLSGWSLKQPNGSSEVQFLQKGAKVLSVDGEELTVSFLALHTEEQEVVSLKAEGAWLEVTGTHRIIIWENEEKKTKLARDLKVGNVVFCGAGDNDKRALIEVHSSKQIADIVQMELKPDKPVQALPKQEQDGIHSRAGWSKARRGDTRDRRSRNRNADAASLASIKTLDPFEM